MSSKTKVQFAFQGGGAKLAALLAVVEAVQSLEIEEIEVTRIAGTSAGAIAATILAFNLDAKAITNHLIISGNQYIDQLIPPSRYPRTQGFWKKAGMYFRIVRSIPIAEIDALRNIYTKIFESTHPDIEKKIKESTTQLHIIAADLFNQKKKTYSSFSSLGDVVDALVNSCAIPIFFKTDVDLRAAPYVDGGLLENLPVESLDGTSGAYGSIFAISFEREAKKPSIRNVAEHILTLLNTAMNNSLVRAQAGVNDFAIFRVPTDIGTFEFEKALKLLSDSNRYGGIREAASRWLIDGIQVTRNDTTEMSLENLLLLNYEIYRKHHFKIKRRFLVSALVVTARCIANKSSEFYSIFDEIKHISRFSAISDPISCICMFSYVNSMEALTAIPEVIVEDCKQQLVPAIVIPAIDTESRNSSNENSSRDILIFFDQPLEPSGDMENLYTVTQREIIRKSMLDLKEKGKDFLSLKNGRPEKEALERADLVLYVPEDDPPIAFTAQTGDTDTEKVRTDIRPMTKSELAEYGHPPLSFRAEGWTIENLQPGEQFGVDVYMR